MGLIIHHADIGHHLVSLCLSRSFGKAGFSAVQIRKLYHGRSQNAVILHILSAKRSGKGTALHVGRGPHR